MVNAVGLRYFRMRPQEADVTEDWSGCKVLEADVIAELTLGLGLGTDVEWEFFLKRSFLNFHWEEEWISGGLLYIMVTTVNNTASYTWSLLRE